jgi:multiple sugar transport system substrate-binding protein
LSLDLIDAKTDKAHLNIPEWKRVFELGRQIYSVPGNMPKKPGSGSVDEFFKNKTLAMLATINYLDKAKDAIAGGLKMGVAQYPSYPEKPNIFGMVDAQVIFVVKQSRHQEDAFRVIETLLSDEVQLLSARQTARNSALKNPEIKKQFAADMDYLKGISLGSIFKSGPGPAPEFSKYYAQGRKILESTFRNYALDQYDVNTALRQGDEEMNQMIQAGGAAE